MATPSSNPDRNLLFGILALQMDFISRDALIAAMHAWVLEKTKPLGQILVEQRKLDPEHLALLEPLVQAHIRAHANDPQHSLAALASASSVPRELSSVADEQLQATLSRVGAAPDLAAWRVSATQEERIDDVCDRFEAAWRRAEAMGQRPRMEDYMGEPSAPEHAVLLCELAALDIAYRRLAGEHPSVAEYRDRFPSLDMAQFATMLARQGPVEPGATIDASTFRTTPGLRYRILRPHATGGLGEVFVALDQELHREVALKEIKEERAHDAVSRRRFLLEAEITGGLEHPGIVPVYGLGQYVDGRPFYAMRFIKGDNLKEAIRRFHDAEHPGRDPSERSLALRQLLRRFIDVCNAVAYAHSRGVLHRDLKPANIMLGKYGETLIVDWGLAKSIGRSEPMHTTEEKTLRPTAGSDLVATVTGTALGTPAYMSPEQAAGRLDLLGPASDIYSLGATLYTLLTGRAPLEESDPVKLMPRVRRGEWLPPRSVNPNTPAALDAICCKAMALRPEDRYPTALALAADLEHWLGDEPISACREGWGARLARYGRRHRPLVTGAAVLLLTAVVLLTVGIVLINREKDRTTEAYARLKQEEKRTQEALAAEARRRQQAREALDMLSSQVIDNWLAKQNQLLPEHHTFLEKAVASYEELARDSGPEEATRAGVARACLRVGNLRQKLGQMAEAEGAYLRSRELCQQLAADFPTVPAYRQELAWSHGRLGHVWADTGRAQDAERAGRDALLLYQRLVADFPTMPIYRQELAGSHNNLGMLLADTGRAEEAERAYREALKLEQQLVADFPSVAGYREYLSKHYYNLGNLLQNTGRVQEAEQPYREALKLAQQLVADFPTVPEYRSNLASSHINLGNLLRNCGRGQEAERAYRAALKLEQQLATDFPAVPEYRRDLAKGHSNLGELLHATGRVQDAERASRDALKLRQQLVADFPTVPAYRQELAISQHSLAELLGATGRVREAEHAYREALKLKQQLVADFPTVPAYRQALAGSHNDLGMLLADTGRADDAERAYREALKLEQPLVAEFPTVPGYRKFLANHHANLGNLLRNTGRWQEAERAYGEALKLEQQLATDFPAVPAYRQNLAKSHTSLGVLLAQTGRAQDAERAFHDALKIERQLVADFPTVPAYRAKLAGSYGNLGLVLQDSGRGKDAEGAYRDALKIEQQLIADFPTVADYRNDVAGTMVNLANCLRRSKELSAARQMLEEALPHHQAALQANPRNPTYREFFRNNRWSLAETLVEMGEHAAAADTAAQLVQAAVHPVHDRYNAARYLARCVLLAEGDGQLSEAQRKERAQTYADRAMATLRQAVQNGYKNVAHMKHDKALDSLRSREDFQKLLTALDGSDSGP